MQLSQSFYNAMKGLRSFRNQEGFGMQIIIDPMLVIPPQGEPVGEAVARWGRQIANLTGAGEATLRVNGNTPEGESGSSIYFIFPDKEAMGQFQISLGGLLAERLQEGRIVAGQGR